MRIGAFAVGIPARDEEEHIEAAIEALVGAAAATLVPVHLAVAVDRCRDATEELARSVLGRSSALASALVVPSDHGCAGGARDLACRTALSAAMAGADDPTGMWVVTTDADTIVPRRWFELQEVWSERGADGLAGLVELDPDDPLPTTVRSRWRAHVEALGSGLGHPHVHGANIGMRADLWLRAGGFGALSVGEDHDLWRRARALGGCLVGTDEIVVRTSPRLVGRAPGGFADLLAGFALGTP